MAQLPPPPAYEPVRDTAEMRSLDPDDNPMVDRDACSLAASLTVLFSLGAGFHYTRNDDFKETPLFDQCVSNLTLSTYAKAYRGSVVLFGKS